MFKKITISVLVLFAGFYCFAYFHFSEKERLGLSGQVIREKWIKAKPGYSEIRTGDLIFRHGRGIISTMLMSFSKQEAKYSHAGIVSVSNEKVYVYHAIGGEENTTNKLRKDLLEDFCNPDGVHSFGIFRLDLDRQQLQEADSLAENYYRQGLEFDTKFDLSDDSKMYCSEFVYKIIVQVTRDQNYLSLTTISGTNYVACDNLYLNAHCSPVYAYQY